MRPSPQAIRLAILVTLVVVAVFCGGWKWELPLPH
jgi:hypothetical protein